MGRGGISPLGRAALDAAVVDSAASTRACLLLSCSRRRAQRSCDTSAVLVAIELGCSLNVSINGVACGAIDAENDAERTSLRADDDTGGVAALRGAARAGVDGG